MKKHLPVIIAVSAIILIAAVMIPIIVKNKALVPDTDSKTENILSDHDGQTPDYREAMRQWVIKIGVIAREYDSSFLLVPQNCAPLFTDSGDAGGNAASYFMSAIDGTGVEGLSYGNDHFGRARDEESKNELIALLNLGAEYGIKVLAVDYLRDENKIEQVRAFNQKYGYVSFIAPNLELTDIPDDGPDFNDEDIIELSDAQNWLCLINPGKYGSKADFIGALAETDYDVLVIDAFFSADEMLGPEDVAALKTKHNGAARIVIAYLSIDEAEDYRYYWKQEYNDSPPPWLLSENPLWEGNYPVEYWHEEWQEIIAAGEDSYLKRIIKAGFDGAYLDIVDGYQTFEDME